jgi:hypothetical protein
MNSGEDLLLLALVPRSGRIREVDRVKFALRASVLVDLALERRISINANSIKVLDTAATGESRLDNALASLSESSAPSLRKWLRGTPSGYGIVNRYLSILADQGVVSVERRPGHLPAPMDATLLDPTRRDEAKAKVDRVAHRRESDEADRALAGLVHTCGLDRHLYRFSPFARARIARQPGRGSIRDEASRAQASTDAAFADAVARATSDGIAQLTAEMVKLLRYEHRIEHNTFNHHHHHDTTSGGHHHGNYSDPGAGHHH